MGGPNGDDESLVARAKKAVPNQGLTWVAVMAARQHKYAIDYIEQAPVLVIGAMFGACAKKLQPNEVAYVANRFRRIEGMKLKQAMGEFHLPYPLRKLRSTAIAPAYSDVIWDLRSVPPSSLSQAIPDKVGHQIAWLQAISRAKARANSRGRPVERAHLNWLAARLGGRAPGVYRRHLADLAADLSDMFLDGRFNPAWTFEEAVSAHARWAVEQAKTSHKAFETTHGVSLDHKVDYSPQPNAPVLISGFEIVPLRSGADLIEEGTLMRHCVPSYMRDIMAAKSCIYSIRKDGKRVATLELASGHGPATIKQIKGPCNAPVAAGVLGAATEFALAIPKPQRGMDVIKGLFGAFKTKKPPASG